MTVFSNILTAIGPAEMLHKALSQEAAAKAGNNRSLSVISQIVETALFISAIQLHTPVPFKVEILAACCLTPTIGITGYLLSDNSLYKKPIRWLYDHFGELMQVATGIHALALLRLGFYAYGTVSLAFLAWGLLEKYRCLPLIAQRVYKTTIPWIALTSLILWRTPLAMTLVAIELSDRAYPKVEALWTRLFPKPKKPKEVLLPLTYAQFETIRKRERVLKVSRNHPETDPFPPTAERDFSKILQAWDAIDWSNPGSNLQREVEADPHWQRSEDIKRYRPAADRDKLGIMRAYAKKQLETFVNNIQHKRIQIGKPLDYAPLENYLGIIAEQLPHLNREKQQTLLLKLALKGRKDYGPDIFTELMEVATDTLFATPTFPFQNRVLLLLQQERFKIVQAYHRALQQLNIFSKLIGSTESMQAMNHTTRLIAEGFRLPHTRAFRDEIPTPLFFERWLCQTFIGISSKSLWETLTLPALSEENEDETIEGYTLKRILDKVRHSRTTGLLSDDYLVSWAQAWIQRPETGATAAQKADFRTLLDQRSAGDVEQETAIINFLTQAALVDMGILQFNS